jgi:hypothetical protein
MRPADRSITGGERHTSWTETVGPPGRSTTLPAQPMGSTSAAPLRKRDRLRAERGNVVFRSLSGALFAEPPQLLALAERRDRIRQGHARHQGGRTVSR